jgi:hypothetical protein
LTSHLVPLTASKFQKIDANYLAFAVLKPQVSGRAGQEHHFLDAVASPIVAHPSASPSKAQLTLGPLNERKYIAESTCRVIECSIFHSITVYYCAMFSCIRIMTAVDSDFKY